MAAPNVSVMKKSQLIVTCNRGTDFLYINYDRNNACMPKRTKQNKEVVASDIVQAIGNEVLEGYCLLEYDRQ